MKRTDTGDVITVALKRGGWVPTLIAIPLAFASRVASDFATSNRFSIKTAEEMLLETYKPEKIEGEGLIVYYAPSFIKEEEHTLFMDHLRAYRDGTNRAIVLFLLLTQDSPCPDRILKSAWATGLFRTGELYEVVTSWQKISLFHLEMFSCLGLIRLEWRRRLKRWDISLEQRHLG